MTRSLEGKKFYTSYNNGVVSITSADVVENEKLRHLIMEKIQAGFGENMSSDRKAELIEALGNGLGHLVGPVFTFVDPERLLRSPWYTGSYSLQTTLLAWIEENGGKIESARSFVPFSNACEHGIHGARAMAAELRYVTTGAQFLETFGITAAELFVRAAASSRS